LHRRFALFVFLTLSQAIVLPAQDTRNVIEPFFPQLCTTLDSQLQTSGRSLAPADEQKLDTARIQRAIDKCGRGRAVLLRVDETDNAFLSGPLELKPDITLIVGLGVTLFASRDPALYAVSPGSCGLVNNSTGSRGCKPLISVDHASGLSHHGRRRHRRARRRKNAWLQISPGGTWPNRPAPAASQQVPRILVADYDSDNFTLYRITLKNSPNFHVVYSHG
jgi:polygalacturonase